MWLGGGPDEALVFGDASVVDQITGDASIVGARPEPKVHVAGSLSDGELVPESGERIRDLALEFDATPERSTFSNATGTIGRGPLRARRWGLMGDGGRHSLSTQRALQAGLLFCSPGL